MKLSWTIIHGKWLGRELGYRTANMRMEPSSTTLEWWTYALIWTIKWKKLEWVWVYLPHISTFESHFLDFDEDIYDLVIDVEILYKIRENEKFESLEKLSIQIGEDIKYMKSVKNYTQFFAIAAMAKNRIIWNEWKIPWHIPEDFKHFKETTLGHPIIMWKNTYLSIGRPLPGRENIVLTRSGIDAEWITLISSIPEIQNYLRKKEIQKAFICGGGQIYSSFFELWLISEVILSVVDQSPPWDVLFPPFESDFILEKEDERKEFTIQIWKKNNN
jgi:dihydrofolate reductase